MAHFEDVKSRFALTRPNFILNPLSEEDSDFFADRTSVNVGNIVENLRIDLSTDLPPKRLLWGPYGGGKTHTLLHTMKKLSSYTPVHHVYVECPDLSKDSSFMDLYREGIMRSLTQDYVLDLFEKVREGIGFGKREEILKKLKLSLQDEELAKACAILNNPTEQNKLTLWSWFSGVAVSKSELIELGQTQDLRSAEPARLARYIEILGKLVKEVHNESLILILDEIDRLRFVGVNTIVQFQTAFTRLLDPNQQDVSVLIGISAQNIDELPEIFQSRTPVTSRLGTDAILQINYLEDFEFEPFVKKMIGYLRDKDCNLNILIENAKKETTEEIREEYFPFTVQAIEAIKVTVGREMTPREITLKMTRIAGKAHNHDKLVITSDLVE